MMNWSTKTALLGNLVSRLRSVENWCGETHLQKTVYFLQEGCRLTMGYDFVLYKHGPYSFDLRLDISRLVGRRMLRQEPSSPPYGPRLIGTHLMEGHLRRFAEAIADHSDVIERVVQFVGKRGVAELERLSTALYVSISHSEESVESRAYRINKLKPHVSLETARQAIQELDAAKLVA